MPKPLTYYFRIFLCYQKQCSVTVAKIVKPYARQLSLCEYRAEIAVGKVRDGKQCALFTAKNQIKGLPHSVKFQPNLSLLALVLVRRPPLMLCYDYFAMTTITILPENTGSYRAFAGDKESVGRTAGEALDALTSQLEDEETGTVVIVQNRKADQFFSAAQQARLIELMQRRKAGNLSTEEEQELESLIEVELNGARQRTKALLDELKA